MDPWWTSQSAGWVGAGIGIAGGIFGTVVGVGGALLRTPRQFAALRAFMLGVAGLGACAAAAGVIGLIVRQPYHVWYPLVLFGALFGILPVVIMPSMRNRFRAMEQRRMQSADLRRG